jgi:ABC-type nitrate/sulfonate/bicarbonate transport system substrate-binding protein
MRVLLLSLAMLVALPARGEALEVMGFAGSSNWPIFVAQERGLFARQGLEVRLAAASSSAAQLASLKEGRIHVAMTAMDNVVAQEDGEVFAFLGATNGGRSALMVAPAITGYAGLRDRVLAVDAVATGYAFVLMEMLRQGGLAPGDYRLQTFGGSRERFAALRDGKAAGALLNAPADAMAEAAGFKRLASSADVLGRYQGSVGAARRAWAAANADALVGYIRAMIAAADWLYDPANRQPAIEILRRRLPGLDAGAAARSYDELLGPEHGGLSRRAALDPEGVRAVLVLRERFATPARQLGEPNRYYDLTYYERALRP